MHTPASSHNAQFRLDEDIISSAVNEGTEVDRLSRGSTHSLAVTFSSICTATRSAPALLCFIAYLDSGWPATSYDLEISQFYQWKEALKIEVTVWCFPVAWWPMNALEPSFLAGYIHVIRECHTLKPQPDLIHTDRMSLIKNNLDVE